MLHTLCVAWGSQGNSVSPVNIFCWDAIGGFYGDLFSKGINFQCKQLSSETECEYTHIKIVQVKKEIGQCVSEVLLP